MPYIKLTANVPVPEEKCEELKAAFGEDVALMGKGERYLMVDFAPNSPLYFSGTSEPAAMVSVDVFGKAGGPAYEAFTAAACARVEAALGIPPSRIFVKYTEYEHWGWNGGNF